MRAAILVLVSMGGCFGGAVPDNADASYGRAPDLAPLCTGNNDGVIGRDELVFPLGLSVNYLVNPSGTTAPVVPAGAPGDDGPQWDLTSTAGEVHRIAIEPLDGKWFAPSFPGGTYATLTDVATGTLGIFQVTDQALLILGYASEAQGQTLFVYDTPIVSLQFPVHKGQGFVSMATIKDGQLMGMPYASTDTYRVTVDAEGTADLPYLRFQHTLRIRVDLTQTLPAGLAISRIQYLFFHECTGEVGRMVSSPNDTNPSFTMAAEFRRLAL